MTPPEQDDTAGFDEPSSARPAAPARSGRRRLVRALAWSALAVLVVALGLFLRAPLPVTARAQLLVASKPPRIIFSTREPESEWRIYQQTQMQLVKSEKVLGVALRALGTRSGNGREKGRRGGLGEDEGPVGLPPMLKEQDDPLTWLEREIQVAFPDGGEIMEISLNGRDPKQTARIVDAVANAYKSETVDAEKMHRLRRQQHLENLHRELRVKLDQARQRVRTLAEALGSNHKETLPYKPQLARAQFDALKSRLLEVQMELLEVEAETEIAEGFELRLMSWGDGSGVPTSGNSLVVVGVDDHKRLHIRAFDAGGTRVTEMDEAFPLHDPRQEAPPYRLLPAIQAEALSSLKQRLRDKQQPSELLPPPARAGADLFPPHALVGAERAQVLSEVTSILGRNPLEKAVVPPQPETAPEVRRDAAPKEFSGSGRPGRARGRHAARPRPRRSPRPAPGPPDPGEQAAIRGGEAGRRDSRARAPPGGDRGPGGRA